MGCMSEPSPLRQSVRHQVIWRLDPLSLLAQLKSGGSPRLRSTRRASNVSSRNRTGSRSPAWAKVTRWLATTCATGSLRSANPKSFNAPSNASTRTAPSTASHLYQCCRLPTLSVLSITKPNSPSERAFYAAASEPVPLLPFATDSRPPRGVSQNTPEGPPDRTATGKAPRSEDQRRDWMERERKACAEPKGGGCFERAAPIWAERDVEGCAGRAVCLCAMYRPPRHPATAPNMVGQWPALRTVPRGTVPASSRDDMPRPA
jgi:hypothetical protein